MLAAVLQQAQPGETRASQLQNATIGPILTAKERNEWPPHDKEKSGIIERWRLLQLWDQLLMRDGILYRQFIGINRAPNHSSWLYHKHSERESVLKELHEGAVGGHLGEEKIFSWFKGWYYSLGNWTDVRNWCQTCGICASQKNPTLSSPGNHQGWYPMQIVAMDIHGPLPESDAGNSYIVVVGNYYTRWMEAYPIPNREATSCNNIGQWIFCRFSIPEQIHSDQGKQFESDIIAEICKLLKINKTRTTPYHPQSDGLVERYNRTLVSMLATCAEEHPFMWEKHVKKMCMPTIPASNFHPSFDVWSQNPDFLLM